MMKKMIVGILGAVLAVSCVWGAVVTNTVKWNVPFGDAFRTVVEATFDAYETQINLNTVAIAAKVAQVDTNETTDATILTPAFIGQVLVGGAGVGTSGVWVAKGITTNDWVVVAP